MKAGNTHDALEGINKEQLKRRVFTLDFKAEVVRHRKAENLTFSVCAHKFDGTALGTDNDYFLPNGTVIIFACEALQDFCTVPLAAFQTTLMLNPPNPIPGGLNQCFPNNPAAAADPA